MTNDLSLFKNAVHEVHSQVQSPIDMCFASALFAASAVSHSIINVEHPTGEISPVSLFITTIAESGERKSATDKKFTQYIRNFEAEILNKEKKRLDSKDGNGISVETQMKVWKSTERKILKELEKCDTDDEGSRRKIIIDLERHQLDKPSIIERKILLEDTTSEALLYSLGHGNKNVSLCSDEGGVILERRSAKDLTHFNKIWDGGTTSIDRVSRPSYRVSDARLSISIMTQREYFYRFARRNNGVARSSGYFARNLFFNPVSTQGSRMTSHVPNACNWLEPFGRRCEDLLEKSKPSSERIVLRLTPEAKGVWNEFYQLVEKNLNEKGYLADARDFGSKIANNMSRIAAIVHFFCNKSGDVDYESMVFARDCCCILIDNFKDMFGDGSEALNNEMMAYQLHKFLYRQFRQDNLLHGIPRSRILQNGPEEIRNAERLDRVLELLKGRGVVDLIFSQSENISLKPLVSLNRHGFYYIEPREPVRQMDARWLSLLRN